MLASICSLFFSYSSTNKTIEENKIALEKTIKSLILEETGKKDFKQKRLLYSDNEEFQIENVYDMGNDLEQGNIDSSLVLNNIVDNMFNFNEDFANIKIDRNTIDIKNFSTFDYVLNFKDYEYITTKSLKNQFKLKKNSVSFTGINVNPQTCMWVNQKLTAFADKIANNYSGVIGITYAALKLTAPAFIAQCTATIAGIINNFTNWLASIGPWGVVIKLVLIIFASIAAVIIAHIVWAGSHNKGFKMGLEWTGWFKAKWVYEFYD